MEPSVNYSVFSQYIYSFVSISYSFSSTLNTFSYFYFRTFFFIFLLQNFFFHFFFTFSRFLFFLCSTFLYFTSSLQYAKIHNLNSFNAFPHIDKYRALIAYVWTALRSPSDSDDSEKSISYTILSPPRGAQ